MQTITWKRAIIGSGGLAALFVAYLLWTGWSKNRQVRQELARLQAAGAATTPAELGALYAIPPGEQDATDAWMAPIAALHSGALGRHPWGLDVLDVRDAFPPPPGEEWTDLERAEQFLVEHADLLAKIDAAIAAPGVCRYIEDFSEGALILLPHAQESRMIVQLLTLRAFVRAHRGESGAALADVEAMLAMSETLAREPILITQMIRSLTTESAVLALEQLLPSLTVDGRRLAQLQQRLLEIDLLAGLRLSLHGERVLGLMMFENPTSGGAKYAPAPVYRAWINDHPAHFLQLMSEVEGVLADDWPGPLALSQRLGQTEGYVESDVAAPWGGGTWPVPSKFTVNYGVMVQRFAVAQARIRGAAAAIAALRYRRKAGAWPNSTGDLTPECLESVPTDPFTGEPLRMNAESGELRIYSVGRDGVDDGGVESTRRDDHRVNYDGKPDVVFSTEVNSAS